MTTFVQSSSAWLEPVESYVLDMRVQGLSEGTVRLRESYVRRLGRDLAGDPWAASTAQLAGWLVGHRWASNTTCAARDSIRGFYTWAARAGHVQGPSAAEDARSRSLQSQPPCAPPNRACR